MKLQEKPQPGAVLKLLNQYKYVLIVIAAGILLLLWPTGDSRQKREGAAQEPVLEDFDLEAMEEKLSRTLSQVEGAGQVTVVLTLRSGVEQVPLTDRSTSTGERGSSVEEKTVVINTGSGQQAAIRVERCPAFQGAVVVCPGGDRAEVRLLLTQAVSSLTGLGADKITVCKGSAEPS